MDRSPGWATRVFKIIYITYQCGSSSKFLSEKYKNIMANLVEVKTRVDELFVCMLDIKTSASDILKKLEPVMKNIKDPNNEIVVQGVKKYPEYTSNLQQAMQNVTVQWVKDAAATKLEIDKFIKFTDEGFIFNFDECPFIAEVWNGDAYDKQGLEGLQELKKDLAKQFADINRENLFILAIKHIKETS